MVTPSELIAELHRLDKIEKSDWHELEGKNLLSQLSRFKASVSLSDLAREGVREARDNPTLHSKKSESIPRTLFKYWDNERLPIDVSLLTKSWQVTNPTFRYVLLDDQSISGFLRVSEFSNIARCYEEVVHPVDRADIARLMYLYVHGGIYVDADHSCIWPIDFYIDLNVPHVLVRRGAKGNMLINSFMASIPQSPLFERTLRNVDNLFSTNEWKKEKIGSIAGRKFLEQSIRELAAEQNHSNTLFCDLYPANICLRSFQRVHSDLDYKENHWSSENELRP